MYPVRKVFGLGIVSISRKLYLRLNLRMGLIEETLRILSLRRCAASGESIGIRKKVKGSCTRRIQERKARNEMNSLNWTSRSARAGLSLSAGECFIRAFVCGSRDDFRPDIRARYQPQPVVLEHTMITIRGSYRNDWASTQRE